jgi:atypical dual specificity phosphatase
MTLIGNGFRWIHGRLASRPTNFSWIIEGKLAGSGMPVTSSQFLWVVTHGVKSIVTVRELPLPSKWYNDNLVNVIDYFHLNVEDYGAPTLEELDNVVRYIQLQIENGKPVMVHCAAGKGRTGTVLGAYLVKVEDLTADIAIKKIRTLRPGSVQSVRQEMAISMYQKYLKG